MPINRKNVFIACATICSILSPRIRVPNGDPANGSVWSTDQLQNLLINRKRQDGLIVTFSDGTVGAYVVEELLELRPHREPIETTTRCS